MFHASNSGASAENMTLLPRLGRNVTGQAASTFSIRPWVISLSVLVAAFDNGRSNAGLGRFSTTIPAPICSAGQPLAPRAPTR
jgi:hypothetical protein